MVICIASSPLRNHRTLPSTTTYLLILRTNTHTLVHSFAKLSNTLLGLRTDQPAPKSRSRTQYSRRLRHHKSWDCLDIYTKDDGTKMIKTARGEQQYKRKAFGLMDFRQMLKFKLRALRCTWIMALWWPDRSVRHGSLNQSASTHLFT